jgi:hypothetical protein
MGLSGDGDLRGFRPLYVFLFLPRPGGEGFRLEPILPCGLVPLAYLSELTAGLREPRASPPPWPGSRPRELVCGGPWPCLWVLRFRFRFRF